MIGLFEGVGGVKAVIRTRISGLDTECEGMVWGPIGLLGRRFGEPPFHRSGTVLNFQIEIVCDGKAHGFRKQTKVLGEFLAAMSRRPIPR